MTYRIDSYCSCKSSQRILFGKPLGRTIDKWSRGFKTEPIGYSGFPRGDNTNRPEFGLIAEEVAEANPDLVVRDKNGEIYTVRYDAVNAMLLNEFLKEHRRVERQECKIQEQETTIAQLKREMETVVTHAKEQDANIQRVSAQVEIRQPAPRMAINP